jgi:hypothetical protein
MTFNRFPDKLKTEIASLFLADTTKDVSDRKHKDLMLPTGFSSSPNLQINRESGSEKTKWEE